MTNNSFFDESKEQSQVKSRIVEKYFTAWARVMKSTLKAPEDKIAYIDLFAGPGRYKDGTDSTPILVLEKALADPRLQTMLVTVFNDADSDNSNSLRKTIDALPRIKSLKHAPTVYNTVVGAELVKVLEDKKLVPTLFFVDPWGYKGLSLDLINAVLKDWGCDCIFFFNYNRINMGLGNQIVEDHMNALFGMERATRLRTRLMPMTAAQRELTIVEEISQALREKGGKYVLPFGFKNASGQRTSHHLIFVTKHFRGYEIMKDIMAKESSEAIQGVPSFAYSPATEQQTLLFLLNTPLEDLEGMLLKAFAGQRLSMVEIYEQHSVDRPYVKRNYKDALTTLEAKGKITAKPAASQRPKRGGKPTFSDKVVVTFPKGA
jgi:three-Cys-motif partner protein